nr:trimeric intracellular cation channel family protein [uncultured Prevotella sp.]
MIINHDPEIVITLQRVIEFIGTFAFALSGIRLAASKHYDWLGGFVCGIAVAIGGGTIRDVMLGIRPFWMLSPIYMICTLFAQCVVIVCHHYLRRLDTTWFLFDTLGLALFNIAGIQKTLECGFPFWVAIIMGCITGAAGGVIRDVLLNEEPVIFRREIYAMACVVGGLTYWLLSWLQVSLYITVIATFAIVCAIRFLAVRYHISLPKLRDEE